MLTLSRFQQEIETNEHISKSDRILVAFSGGKDSVCLLFLLHSLRDRLKIQVGACHIHHNIRGKDADEDLSFCKKFCLDRDIPFFCEKVDAPTYSKQERMGLEESARILRYEALANIALQNGYDKIATAHTASDQAETVLFHLIRGSGMDGMCGIPSERGNIIRPLLSFYQEEILLFLKENHLSFREDSSNRDVIYARNRLRNEVLPQMKHINPSVEKSLVRFSQIAKEENALIFELCNQWERENKCDCRSGSLSLQALTALAKNKNMFPILREALTRMTEKEKIVIDFQHFKALQGLLKQPSEGKIIEISNGFVFRIERNQLRFVKNESIGESIEYQVKLSYGVNQLPIPRARLCISDKRRGTVENINKKSLIIHAAFDKIEGDLFVRNRRVGDGICVGGMTKSLKKLFQEAKIPQKDRDHIPLICDDKGIVWIPFIGLSDRVRSSNTGEVFTMEFTSEHFQKNESN